VASINHSSRPVISLSSAFQSRRGGWAEDIGCELVSCDDEGSIRVWQAHSSSSYLEAGVSMQGHVPCCSLAVRKGFVVAGGADGCVRIYNLVWTQPLTANMHMQSVHIRTQRGC
jgi:WD40 repeat protein